MRIPGYCTVCRRIRNVRVSSAGMVSLTQKRVAQGVCASCEEEQQQRRSR